MRLKTLIPLLLIMVVCSGCQKIELQEFSPDGTYKVLFPEKKEFTEKPINGTAMKIWTTEFNQGALLFISMTFPLSGVSVADQENLLKQSQDGASNAIHGVLQSENSIKLNNKYLGREFAYKVKIPNKSGFGEIEGISKCRLYIVKDRMLMLQVIGKPEWTQKEECTRFLDSLQIIKE